MDTAHSHNIFYYFGKGAVKALLAFALPAVFVFAHYSKLDRWSELPVLDAMQGHFQTGLQLVGSHFRTGRQHFFTPDTEALTDDFYLSPAAPTPVPHRLWHRQTLENELLAALPAEKHAAVLAFLDYIEAYRDLATHEMLKTHIPASVTLAQGLLESDAGRSFLALRANNHFGIKCRQLSGGHAGRHLSKRHFDHHRLATDCVQRTDDHPWDHFEVYPTVAGSFRRHSLLLLSDRYAWMIDAYPVGEMCALPRPIYGVRQAPYYVGWAMGLKDSGYATSKRYAEKLTLIIETYALWKIDYETCFPPER